MKIAQSWCATSRRSITKTCLFKYTENFTIKKWKFSDKNSDKFHISAQNIHCWYSLEPPRRGGSNEYPQSMFLSRNKKNNVYHYKPQYYCKKKWGLRGSNLYRHVFVMQKEENVWKKLWIKKCHIWNNRRRNNEDLQQRNRLGTDSRKIALGLNRFYSREPLPLILMQLQRTTIWSVRIMVLYLLCEKSKWKAYNQNHCDETKQWAQWRSEAITK